MRHPSIIIPPLAHLSAQQMRKLDLVSSLFPNIPRETLIEQLMLQSSEQSTNPGLAAIRESYPGPIPQSLEDIVQGLTDPHISFEDFQTRLENFQTHLKENPRSKQILEAITPQTDTRYAEVQERLNQAIERLRDERPELVNEIEKHPAVREGTLPSLDDVLNTLQSEVEMNAAGTPGALEIPSAEVIVLQALYNAAQDNRTPLPREEPRDLDTGSVADNAERVYPQSKEEEIRTLIQELNKSDNKWELFDSLFPDISRAPWYRKSITEELLEEGANPDLAAILDEGPGYRQNLEAILKGLVYTEIGFEEFRTHVEELRTFLNADPSYKTALTAAVDQTDRFSHLNESIKARLLYSLLPDISALTFSREFTAEELLEEGANPDLAAILDEGPGYRQNLEAILQGLTDTEIRFEEFRTHVEELRTFLNADPDYKTALTAALNETLGEKAERFSNQLIEVFRNRYPVIAKELEEYYRAIGEYIERFHDRFKDEASKSGDEAQGFVQWDDFEEIRDAFPKDAAWHDKVSDWLSTLDDGLQTDIQDAYKIGNPPAIAQLSGSSDTSGAMNLRQYHRIPVICIKYLADMDWLSSLIVNFHSNILPIDVQERIQAEIESRIQAEIESRASTSDYLAHHMKNIVHSYKLEINEILEGYKTIRIMTHWEYFNEMLFKFEPSNLADLPHIPTEFLRPAWDTAHLTEAESQAKVTQYVDWLLEQLDEFERTSKQQSNEAKDILEQLRALDEEQLLELQKQSHEELLRTFIENPDKSPLAFPDALNIMKYLEALVATGNPPNPEDFPAMFPLEQALYRISIRDSYYNLTSIDVLRDIIKQPILEHIHNLPLYRILKILKSFDSDHFTTVRGFSRSSSDERYDHDDSIMPEPELVDEVDEEGSELLNEVSPQEGETGQGETEIYHSKEGYMRHPSIVIPPLAHLTAQQMRKLDLVSSLFPNIPRETLIEQLMLQSSEQSTNPGLAAIRESYPGPIPQSLEDIVEGLTDDQTSFEDFQTLLEDHRIHLEDDPLFRQFLTTMRGTEPQEHLNQAIERLRDDNPELVNEIEEYRAFIDELDGVLNPPQSEAATEATGTLGALETPTAEVIEAQAVSNIVQTTAMRMFGHVQSEAATEAAGTTEAVETSDVEVIGAQEVSNMVQTASAFAGTSILARIIWRNLKHLQDFYKGVGKLRNDVEDLNQKYEAEEITQEAYEDGVNEAVRGLKELFSERVSTPLDAIYPNWASKVLGIKEEHRSGEDNVLSANSEPSGAELAQAFTTPIADGDLYSAAAVDYIASSMTEADLNSFLTEIRNAKALQGINSEAEIQNEVSEQRALSESGDEAQPTEATAEEPTGGNELTDKLDTWSAQPETFESTIDSERTEAEGTADPVQQAAALAENSFDLHQNGTLNNSETPAVEGNSVTGSPKAQAVVLAKEGDSQTEPPSGKDLSVDNPSSDGDLSDHTDLM